MSTEQEARWERHPNNNIFIIFHGLDEELSDECKTKNQSEHSVSSYWDFSQLTGADTQRQFMFYTQHMFPNYYLQNWSHSQLQFSR